MVEKSYRAEMDSIIIALLEDLVEAKHGKSIRYVVHRANPNDSDGLYLSAREPADREPTIETSRPVGVAR